MKVFKYIKFIIRDFIGLEDDYGIIVSDLDKIIEKLEKIEVESQQLNLSDYLTLKNLLLKKGIDENKSLDRPVSDFIQPRSGGTGLVFLTDNDFNN